MQKIVLFDNKEIKSICVKFDNFNGERDFIKTFFRGAYLDGIDNQIEIKTESGKSFKFNFFIDNKKSFYQGYDLFNEIAGTDSRVKLKVRNF